MPVFQYQCGECNSVFEQLVSANTIANEISCLNCGSFYAMRLESTYFYPNKNFCPHDKELDKEKLRNQLSGIMSDQTLRCGGCGTDGASGKCGSGGKSGGCGSGSCGGCGCSSKKKLTLDIYSPLV